MPRAVPTHRPRPGTSKAEANRRYDRTRRDAASKAFYRTRAWQGVRQIKLRRDPACELCRAQGRLVQATHVHHVIEISVDRSKALDVDNLQSLCSPCHTRLHKAADAQK